MEDADGCQETECFPGVVCMDVPAPGVGALCGACPQGYVGDGGKCLGLLLIYIYMHIYIFYISLYIHVYMICTHT